MKLKILKILPHPKKIAILIGAILFFSIAFFTLNYGNNSLTLTQGELEKLYETSFTDCTVTKIEERQYPGRGVYTVFYTNCSPHVFPILLDRTGNLNHNKLIKVDVKLTKEAKSTALTVTDATQVNILKLRSPEDEDDCPLSTRMALVFMGVISGVILIIPNAVFDKKS